jgi:hypothetical protein
VPYLDLLYTPYSSNYSTLDILDEETMSTSEVAVSVHHERDGTKTEVYDLYHQGQYTIRENIYPP